MRLMVGLGNPGAQYARHRHNIGFMALIAIAELQGLGPWRKKYQGLFCEGTVAGHRVGLLMPQTFMNKSGYAVHAAQSFFKVKGAETYVFHDELDLAPGKIRVKRGGGVAGHNGLRSIMGQCGGPDFWRVRLGIGHPGDKARVHSYVLGDFAKAEETWLVAMIAALAQEFALLAAGEAEKYMSRVAMHVQAETKSAEPTKDDGKPSKGGGGAPK